MAKFLYFALVSKYSGLIYPPNTIDYILKVCITVGLALAHHDNDHGHSWYDSFLPSFLTPTVSSICATPNNTMQIKFLTQILAFFNTAQGNISINAVLQSRDANYVQYVKNPNNQALLYSNCSLFVSGLVAAKKADIAAERATEQISHYIDQQIRQIPRNITGSNGPNDMDVRC
jgi:hypothetical protein